ncbi:hypothetical protein HHK36_011504 [Tetracentron sinense]|uniref:Uncharacterized protein n=1 Tax=Tetracentron sinense TaxID=13715 RepID=A0A834ZIR1_TETSI|nr:hypothetical protein HHK36_011504 [Tetracentron sinense]
MLCLEAVGTASTKAFNCVDRDMDSPMGVGFMAVFAVSGSVALVALQLHKRLLSDFMKKMELQLGGACPSKKKVRFADDVLEPSSNNKEYRNRCLRMPARGDRIPATANILEVNMPLNRCALYKGVIESRTLKGYTV